MKISCLEFVQPSNSQIFHVAKISCFTVCIVLFDDYQYSNCLSNNVSFPPPVSGCTTPAAPKHGWVRRQGSKLTAGCNSSDDMWQMTCTDGIWQGKMENCTPGNINVLSYLNLGASNLWLEHKQSVCLSVCLDHRGVVGQ